MIDRIVQHFVSHEFGLLQEFVGVSQNLVETYKNSQESKKCCLNTSYHTFYVIT